MSSEAKGRWIQEQGELCLCCGDAEGKQHMEDVSLGD